MFSLLNCYIESLDRRLREAGKVPLKTLPKFTKRMSVTIASAHEPVASILILVYRNTGHLIPCLDSIQRAGFTVPFEIIVAFNETPLSEVERLCKDIQGVQVLRSNVNRGFSGGNNFAAAHARGRNIVLLNDDTLVEPGWLEALVETAESAPDIGAVGSRIVFFDGTLQEAGALIWRDGTTIPLGRGLPADSQQFMYRRTADYCSANGLLVKREVWDQLGGLDESFFPAYYEDVDFCLGIRHRLGQKVVFEPRARIRHLEAQSSDERFRSFLFRRNVERLRQKWGKELQAYEPADPTSAAALERALQRSRGLPTRVLVIDDRIPNASLGSGFGRLEELVKDVAGGPYAVTFVPTATPEGDRTALGRDGVEVIDEAVTEHLARPERIYDVVIVSRPHNIERFGALIRTHQPMASLVYDAEALFHRRIYMQAEMETDSRVAATLREEGEKMRLLEESLARDCDRIVCISLDEEAVLKSVEGHCPTELIVPIESGIVPGTASFGDRTGLVFVAGWLAGDRSPNIPALAWFVKSVLPLIVREVPDVRVRVSGRNVPKPALELAGPNVSFSGFVRDLDEFYAGARVAIAPITYGAGVKIKTIEAMQRGVPVVATPVGAEGLGLRDSLVIDIAEDAETFAARVVHLLEDEPHWNARRDAMAAFVASLAERTVKWSDVISRAASERKPIGRTIASV